MADCFQVCEAIEAGGIPKESAPPIGISWKTRACIGDEELIGT